MKTNYSNNLYNNYEKVLNKLDKITYKLNNIEKNHKKDKLASFLSQLIAKNFILFYQNENIKCEKY